ncbi:hypothetical protein ES332_D01G233100v1 [Gossypium tomentosum]|uniref:Uncharacterized protein n=1 Tax=Gossypium tomentosum TaxID=34277 RepID=A0A5D2MD23_GOSTO|nr:hypothetical protein ES332_D01G233100v1 [Gossypium tomentosum]
MNGGRSLTTKGFSAPFSADPRAFPGVRRPYSDMARRRDQLDACGVEAVVHVRGQSLIAA